MKKIKHRNRNKKTYNLLITFTIISIITMSTGYSAFNTNINLNTKANIIKKYWNFNYINTIQSFIAPKTGTYKVEVLGGQGSDAIVNTDMDKGGYGAYSVGYIFLKKNTHLYISVGGKGKKL